MPQPWLRLKKDFIILDGYLSSRPNAVDLVEQPELFRYHRLFREDAGFLARARLIG